MPIKKAAPAKKTASPIAAAVAALRTFVAALKKRPDVRVEAAELGGKADSADLDRLRSHPDIPAELVELYAELNGAHVEWSFIEPPGGGTLHIAPIGAWTRFTGDDEHYLGLGDAFEAMKLDSIQPEGGTWIVRSKETGQTRILFASAGCGSEGIVAADSLAGYLRAAVDRAFVHDWPRCFEPSPHVSYAAQEAAITRFRAPPRPPAPIHRGVRVHFSYFSEGGRGEVLGRHEAPESHLTAFCGRALAHVRLDEGSTGWIPLKWLKAQKKRDAYERLRDPGVDLLAQARENLLALCAALAGAIGPVRYFSTGNFGKYPGNARMAAGLLAPRALAVALPTVVELHRAARAAGLDFDKNHAVDDEDRDGGVPLYSYRGPVFSLSQLFKGLFGGLFILACHASARYRLPGSTLCAPGPRLLEGIEDADTLREALQRDTPLTAPVWHPVATNPDTVRELGLPADAVALVGTGF